MQGKIVKGISGFYYVHVGEPGIYECKAKGAFRNQKIKPLVGDDVEIAIVDEETKKGNIEKILPRKNELIRPAVANIDLALIIFAAAKPKPNLSLLDRFLISMEQKEIPSIFPALTPGSCQKQSKLIFPWPASWLHREPAALPPDFPDPFSASAHFS